MRNWRCSVVCAGALLLLASTGHGAEKQAKHVVLDVITISGEEYTVKDETGQEGKIRVGSDTEKYGHVNAGDRIEAWVFPDGHARTVLILRSAAAIQDDRENEKQAEAQLRAQGQQEAGHAQR